MKIKYRNDKITLIGENAAEMDNLDYVGNCLDISRVYGALTINRKTFKRFSAHIRRCGYKTIQETLNPFQIKVWLAQME